LYFMLYGGVAMAAVIACIYLCVRRSNAFAPDITPPLVLRRWAAAFFAVAFLSHIWWFLFCIYSNDINSVSCMVVSVVDCVTLLTTLAGTLLSMLQDRKRSVWPVVMAVIPYAALMALNTVKPNPYYWHIAIAYILLFYVVFTIYMVFAVRQYGRWLRDNYADLEHKEVWVSHVLIIAVLLLIISDGVNLGDIILCYIEQSILLVLFSFLLWRVETLPLLENTLMEPECGLPDPESSQVTGLPLAAEGTQVIGLPLATNGTQEPDIETQAYQSLVISSKIEQLLAERCVDTQLYLQHDLTLLQLAQTIGTNRFYLSQYFSSKGITYNAYINDLRINHFMSLYREATAAHKPVIAQQLASASGYRSYSTFSLAFKQRMGQTVTVWMRETAQK